MVYLPYVLCFSFAEILISIHGHISITENTKVKFDQSFFVHLFQLRYYDRLYQPENAWYCLLKKLKILPAAHTINLKTIDYKSSAVSSINGNRKRGFGKTTIQSWCNYKKLMD